MGFYRQRILPYFINLAMQNKADTEQRAQFIPRASGAVLEVGAGSGLNIPFYGPGVTRLYALDPSVELWKMAQGRVKQAAFPVEFLAASAEEIPLGDEAVDTVVTTWTLCSVQDAARALGEMKRVLKPRGVLIFVEHGWAPDRSVRGWQKTLNPVWKRIAGGCNLNRRMDQLIIRAGFHIRQLETGYKGGPKALTYSYKGLAERPA